MTLASIKTEIANSTTEDGVWAILRRASESFSAKTYYGPISRAAKAKIEDLRPLAE